MEPPSGHSCHLPVLLPRLRACASCGAVAGAQRVLPLLFLSHFSFSFFFFFSFFFSNPAPVSRSLVLFSCLPSRFAQENASVACHESARLPRPPLPLLLAHRKHKPSPPPTHLPPTPPPPPPPATIHLFLEGKLSRLFCFFSYKISDGTFFFLLFFCCLLSSFFFTVPKEKLLWV